jgi:hypothetical protein
MSRQSVPRASSSGKIVHGRYEFADLIGAII